MTRPTSRRIKTLLVAASAVTMSGLVDAHEPAAAAKPTVTSTAAAVRCPTPEERARVAERYAGPTAGLPLATAPALKLPEAVVAAAMPTSMSIGVAASEFTKVWETLPAWGEVLSVLMKGGNVFEVETTIPTGKPSERSAFFNLAKAPLTGHLRPDLMGTIHLLEVPAKDGLVRGITFYGQDGQAILGYFISGEGRTPTPVQQAAFERTRSLLASLPRICTAP